MQFACEQHFVEIRLLIFFVVFLKINGELYLALSLWILELKSCQLKLGEIMDVPTQYLTQTNFLTLCWNQKAEFLSCGFHRKSFWLYEENLFGVDIAFHWSFNDWLIPSACHSSILRKSQGQQAWNCWPLLSGSKPYASGAMFKTFEP